MAFAVEGPRLGQARRCMPVLRALPQWFGFEQVNAAYEREIDELPTFTVSTGGAVVGFLSLKRHFDVAAEIHVLGVRPELHRRGYGRALMARAEQWCAAEGVRVLQVKTLGPSAADEGYARTRAFYSALGFVPLEETTAFWGERQPTLVLVKPVTPAPTH